MNSTEITFSESFENDTVYFNLKIKYKKNVVFRFKKKKKSLVKLKN